MNKPINIQHAGGDTYCKEIKGNTEWQPVVMEGLSNKFIQA